MASSMVQVLAGLRVVAVVGAVVAGGMAQGVGPGAHQRHVNGRPAAPRKVLQHGKVRVSPADEQQARPHRHR